MKQTMFGLVVAVTLARSAAAGQMVEAAAPVPPAPGQTISDPLLAGTEQFAKGAKEANEINMDGKTLGMLGDKREGSDLPKKMDFVVVRNYTYEKPGMYRQEDVDAIVGRLRDGSWSCIVHTRSAKESADICMRQSADHETNEMVVVASEPKEVSFIHLKGRMSLADLQKMGSNVGGPGSMGTPVPPAPPLQPRKP